ncbi:MAG: glutathione S-transferase [Aliiglaciecola sp.]|uniref:glutathione S-transferase family protein n=1 Tax=Aliiglaciecola sp. M165 TaxID=2593649 RepID=UPI00117E1CE4|nr:glutathione S-transferase [Aliiglaciecola sp. M165]TRY33494.1 glutathione S-transferase [Aliiglaciecola sp. M165]
MKIYDVANFPNPLRVRIALAEKNALSAVQFVPVDVLNGEHRQKAFLDKNPNGTVPVLELDDGTYIAECSAIIEYIDMMHSGPDLLGTSAKQKALVHMLQRRMESNVLDAVANYFHHATEGLGPDLETTQFADWGEFQKQRAQAGMKYANELLEENKFIAGDEFSVADITLYAGLVFADFAKVDIDSSLKALAKWRSLVAARPSLAQVA